MAKVIQCDRCGKIYEYEKRPFEQMSIGFYDGNYDEFYSEYVWDLCPECMDEVIKFMGFENNDGHIKKKEKEEVEEDNDLSKDDPSDVTNDIINEMVANGLICNIVDSMEKCVKKNGNPSLTIVDVMHMVNLPFNINYELDIINSSIVFRYNHDVILRIPKSYTYEGMLHERDLRIYEKK